MFTHSDEFLISFVANRSLSVTILSDSMPKQVGVLRHTVLQSFPGASIARIHNKLEKKMASINFNYTILHVGTNDVDSSLKVAEIMSYYENLVTYIKSHSSTKLIISAIIPRPCDSEHDPSETRVRKLNRELKSMCLRFYILSDFFLHCNKPIRSLYAVKDGGLHLNTEGCRKLRAFFINTIAHLP